MQFALHGAVLNGCIILVFVLLYFIIDFFNMLALVWFCSSVNKIKMKCIVHQAQSMFAWKPICMLVCFHLRTLTLKSTNSFFQVFKSKLTILETRGVYIYIYTYLYVFIAFRDIWFKYPSCYPFSHPTKGHRGSRRCTGKHQLKCCTPVLCHTDVHVTAGYENKPHYTLAWKIDSRD